MPRLQGRIDLDGAIIAVRIELGTTAETFLRAAGRSVPPPVATTALIDIGASHTVVHPMILDRFGGPYSARGWVSVPGQPEVILNHYDVRVILGDHRPAFEVQAVKLAPATHTVAVLIGRDLLKQGVLLYDGQNETFSFWF